MVTVYSYNQLGHANHGWLDARHHFSFANYWNPARTGFGTLLVINDDKVAAGTGFGTHPHDNMEIITYVREGAITHQDSMGNTGRTGAGDVQVMSAGTGVRHSEYNRESVDTRLYQIWILPNEQNVKPRWDAREFPKTTVANGNTLPLLVSGNPDDGKNGALFIHQDATIHGGTLKAGTVLDHAIKHQAYILASKGSLKINDVAMNQGDGAEVTETKTIKIEATTDAEILVIDAPVS